MVGEALDHIEVALDPSSDHGVDDDADGMTGARVGTQVGMVWSGNLVTCELVARDGGRFRLRPAGRVDVVDVRSVTRSPTSLDATWIGTTGRPWAAAVVDLSLRGARVVLPVEAAVSLVPSSPLQATRRAAAARSSRRAAMIAATSAAVSTRWGTGWPESDR